MAGEGRYFGVVKKCIPATASRPAQGFIDCAETAALYGRDVFCHDKLANSLTVGQTVSFGVNVNASGMPQAIDVTDENGQPIELQASVGLTGFEAQSAQQWPGAQAAPQWSGVTSQRLYEVLMPEAAGSSGKQVATALLEAAEMLGVGHDLRNAVLGGSKGGKGGGGGPQWPAQQSWEPSWSPPDKGWAKGSSKGWSSEGSSFGKKGGGKKGGKSGPYPAAPSGGDGATYDGVVKTVNKADASSGGKPFGFIECAETAQIYGRDVFLHSQQAQELEVGQAVRFEVMLNNRGMPQAHNLVKFG